jgi:hypothetical protein
VSAHSQGAAADQDGDDSSSATHRLSSPPMTAADPTPAGVNTM